MSGIISTANIIIITFLILCGVGVLKETTKTWITGVFYHDKKNGYTAKENFFIQSFGYIVTNLISIAVIYGLIVGSIKITEMIIK